jgi:hypothetical protein
MDDAQKKLSVKKGHFAKTDEAGVHCCLIL